MIELRNRRDSWRLAGLLSGGRRPADPAVVAGLVVGLAVVVVVPLVAAYFLVGWWLVWVLVALAVLGGAVLLYGRLWWGTGGGAPVLQVDGDVVRARIRVARRGAYRPGDDGWWDAVLGPADITGARMARTDGRFGLQLLAVDLTPERRRQLLDDADLGGHAARIDAAAGSPLAWNAPAMYPRRTRRGEVDRLLTALRALAERP